MIIIITILIYFVVLYGISLLTGRGGNDAFFRGNRKSPWPLVAFGMIGASISGVTFVSVPGMILGSDMTYLQMCIGFFFGYLIVAFVLMPLYYRYNVTSIYGYLDTRLGYSSRKTGAWFFIISKLLGSAAKLYLVCTILHQALHLPFIVTVLVALCLIWLYTHRGGIRTIVWTDALQTLCLLGALVMILIQVGSRMNLDVGGMTELIQSDSHFRIFEFSDWSCRQHFVKQFLSGIFIVIVMTGLDQDMMQKNLTCSTLRNGQKNLCCYGILFLPVNLLFLALGIVLTHFYATQGLSLPEQSDNILPQIVTTGYLGEGTLIFFTIGIIAAAFSSADSALTALTTSYCIDILEDSDNEKRRSRVHLCMMGLFIVFVMLFHLLNNRSVIDLIYTLVSYTYGPLLGLFTFAICTHREPNSHIVPWVAIASPLICYAIDITSQHLWEYHFGYELLIFNGLLTFCGLFIRSKKVAVKKIQ